MYFELSTNTIANTNANTSPSMNLMSNPSNIPGTAVINEPLAAELTALLSFLEPLPQSAVITTHMQPDADAIGSACALKGLLEQLGVSARVINESPTPSNLQFLPEASSIELYDALVHDPVLQSAHVIFCCDLNDLRRTGRMAGELANHRSRIVMIDHHTNPQPFYSACFHDNEATSTAELMYRLIKYRWPQLLGATVATNIYAGVMSDTGNFRFPRVTASTHRMVAELLECGADPVDIYNRMNNTWSMAKTRLLGSVLSTMELHCNGQLCTLTVPYALVDKENCSVDDLEGMVHYTLSVAGVRCGVLIAERGNGSEIKLSFRSKGDVVVNGVAATFGGGGHIYAAGARTSQASLLQVKDEVIARIAAVLPA